MGKRFKSISFPRDGQAHDAITEWWYFNGHLYDHSGKRYDFMNCLFKTDPKRAKVPFVSKILLKEHLLPIPHFYSAHSLILDIKKRKNYKKIQHVSLVSHDSFRRPLLFVNYIDAITVPGYTNCEICEVNPFNFHLKTENLDLRLKSKKQPLLVGGRGYISLWDLKSYYYSLTDLSAKGEIAMGDKKIKVTGRAWMDHQWANITYNNFYKNKWSWFSLQLENGTEIMCVEYDNGKNKEYQVDLINKSGKQEHYNNLLLIPSKDVWYSRKTKAKYPLSWIIAIPEKNIELKVSSARQNQEMIFNKINYWEAPMKVTGIMAGKKVRGLGFMELVGYPSDYNFLLLAGKEVNKKIRQELRKSRKRMFGRIKRKLPRITHLTTKQGLEWASRLRRIN